MASPPTKDKRQAITVFALVAIMLLLIAGTIPTVMGQSPAGPAPEGLQANTTSNGVLLTWTESTNPAFLHYTVHRAEPMPGATDAYQEITGPDGIPTAAFTDRTVEPKKIYRYKVAVVTSNSTSDLSDSIEVTAPRATATDTDIIELGDITYTPGAIKTATQNTRQNYKFILTARATVNITLGETEKKDIPLLTQTLDAGTYYVTFNISTDRRYTLRYTATPTSDTTSQTETPPTTPGVENPGIVINLGDITGTTGTIAHHNAVTHYTFTISRTQNVRLVLADTSNETNTIQLMDENVAAGKHTIPVPTNLSGTFRLSYEAQPPASTNDQGHSTQLLEEALNRHLTLPIPHRHDASSQLPKSSVPTPRPTCPHGFYWSGNGCYGLTTPEPTAEPTEEPTSCPDGQHLSDGACVPDPPVNCPDGQHLSDGACVPDTPVTCSDGYHLSDGACVPDQVDCPPGYYLGSDNNCYSYGPSNRSPYFTSNPTDTSVPENTEADTTVFSGITATDPDGNTIYFRVSPTIHLKAVKSGNSATIHTTDTPFDYEEASSHNVAVTVRDSRGARSTAYATLTITDLPEDESITLDQSPTERPITGSTITATITGGDRVVGTPTWTWQSADSTQGPWTDIQGTNSQTYTPDDSVVDKHLRATASYSDPHGSNTGESNATRKVLKDPYDPNLKSLSLTPVNIHEFSPTVRNYAVGLPPTTTSATMTLKTATADATVTVQRSGTSSSISPSSTNGDTKTYTFSTLPTGLTTTTIKVATARKRATYKVEIGRAVTTTFGWRADKDFNNLRRTSDSFTNPVSATSDGTTVWVAYAGTNVLYAYNSSGGARNSSNDVTLPSGTNPTAVQYQTNAIYVAQKGAADLKAYDTSGTEQTAKTITTSSPNRNIVALWSNTDNIWAADASRRRVYAYDLSTRNLDTSKQYNNISSYPSGLHSNGYTMWITDRQNRRAYAYEFETKRRESINDLRTLSAAGNSTPAGTWGNTTTLWIADRIKNKLYAYNLPALSDDTSIASFTLDGQEYVTQADVALDPNKVITNEIDDAITAITITITPSHTDAQIQIAKVNSPGSRFSSGTELTYDTNLPGYQAQLNQNGNTHFKVKVTAQDGTTTREHHYLTTRPNQTELTLYGFKIKPAGEPETQVRGLDYSVPNTVENITITPLPASNNATASITAPPDTDTSTTGHQATLANGPNAFTVTVEDNDSPYTETHTINIIRADGTTTWDPRFNLNLHASNHEPWGLWSDNTTMWVPDYDRGLLFGYNQNSRAYKEVKDINLRARAHQHYAHRVNPTDIWSDSTNFWTASRFTWGNPISVDVLPRIHQLAPPPDPTTDFTELIDQRTHSLIYDATGIWSDGDTLWIADEVDHHIYALTLPTLTRDASKDIPLHTVGTDEDLKNEDPTGIWSDRMTMWVVDQADLKLYAYAMRDDPDTQPMETFGARVPSKDAALEYVNNEPRGLWGRPGIIWVVNDGCPNSLTGTRFDHCDTGHAGTDTIYAYTVATSSRTDLKVTVDSQNTVTLTPPDEDNPSSNTIVQSVGSDAPSVTVLAEPVDIRATVEFVNVDTDPTTTGLQVDPPLGEDPTLVTVIVTAQDQQTTHTYRIHIHRNPSTPLPQSSTIPAYQTLNFSWNAPADTGTSPLTHYEFRYIPESAADKDNDDNWTVSPTKVPADTSPLEHSLYDLTNGTPYEIQLRALTAFGNSPWSESITGTPSGKPTFDDDAFTAEIPENSPPETIVGRPIAASDPDGDPIIFSLTGQDNDNFVIDNNGLITVSHTADLDYETTSSYTITIQITDNRRELDTDADPAAIDSTKQATITITNAQERGNITFDRPYPQVNSAITASITDPDVPIQNITWEWLKFDDTTNTWTTIENQTASSYTPTADDSGHYLSAIATYDDALDTGIEISQVTDHPVLDADARLSFAQDEYAFPLLENLPTKYHVGTILAGPGQVTYAITTQPSGNYFDIDDSGVIKTTKIWDYETPADRGPHSLTVTATRTTDSTTDTATVSISLENQLEHGENLTLTDKIPGITWTFIPYTSFVMAKEGTARAPQYELNIHIKCVNNYSTGNNNYSAYLRVWQDGPILRYPTTLPTQNDPFPNTGNPLLQPELWNNHDLTNPRPAGSQRPGSRCPVEYTDLWNDATTLYAMDATNRLIKAHDLTDDGLVITRNQAKDIPVTDDHYRTSWKIRGIWGDASTIWATAAETAPNEGRRSAAYSRSTFMRDTTKDHTASPPLTLSQDHGPARSNFYYPADMWRGPDHLWFLHISYRQAAGALNPAETAPTALASCTTTNATTKELQLSWSERQANVPLRITGSSGTTKRLFILSHDSRKILTFDTSKCLPELINSEFSYRDIRNRPERPLHPGFPQAPTGISTHKDTPQMYFSFATGEIRYVRKILPLITPKTIKFPENSPPSVPAGPRFDPTNNEAINQSPYTWAVSGPDQSSFDHQTTGEGSQYLQLLTKAETYDYETKPSYSLTLTVKDVDDDTQESQVTANLININEPATGDVSITGDPYVGRTLTATHTNVTDPDGLTQNTTPVYKWRRNGRPISSATAKTYTLQQADYRKLVSVDITYTDDGGFTNTLAPRPMRVGYIPITASFSEPAIEVTEGSNTTATLNLNEAPHREVTIDVAIVTNEETKSSDYTVSSTELTFSASETSKTITIETVDDRIDEDDEDLTLELDSLPTQVTTGTNGSIVVTILDDDTSQLNLTEVQSIEEGSTTTYSVDLGSQPTASVTVHISLPAQPELSLSTDSLVFTEDNWDTPQTVTITASEDDDAIHEDPRTLSHTITSDDAKYQALSEDLIVTVTDDDRAGVTLSKTSLTITEGATGTYTMRLDTKPSAYVIITIAENSNEDITPRITSQTFTPINWNSPKTITVDTVDDADAPDDTGLITHTISATTIAQEYLQNPPEDHAYPAVTIPSLPVTVTDPDEADIVLSKGATTITEGGTDIYTVKLQTQPTGPVTIEITGHADKPVTLDNEQLQFTSTDWNTPKTVTLTADDDRDAEIPPNITLPHQATGADYANEEKDLTISITETDTASVAVTPTALTTVENAYAEYTVVLTSQPLVNVNINLLLPTSPELNTTRTVIDDQGTPDTADDVETQENISSLTFTSQNWNIPQTVRVNALDDADAVDEPNQNVSHETDTTDNLYKSIEDIDQVTVTVTDDEPEVTVNFESTTYSTTEGETAATVTITLSEDPNRTVIIPFSGSPTPNTGTSASDYDIPMNSVTFQAGETSKSFTVTAIDDDVDDDGESVTISIPSNLPPRVNLGTAAYTVVALVDDDHPIITIRFDPAFASIEEAQTTTFKAILSAAPEREVTINLSKSNGTNTTLADYSGVPDTLTFNPNDTQANFTAQAVDDAFYEQDETLTIGFQTIQPTERITPTTPTTAVLTIRDNDDSALDDLTVSNGAFSIPFSSTTTAYTVDTAYSRTTADINTATRDARATVEFLDNNNNAIAAANPKALTAYPLAIGDNTLKVKVTAPSAQRTTTYLITITRAKPSVSITPERSPIVEGTDAVFTVQRSAAAADSLVVTINTDESGQDDSKVAASNEKDHSITIAPSATTATLTIPTIPDTTWEPHSTLAATIVAKTHYSVTANASADVTIEDDDLPALAITWDAPDKTVTSENHGDISLTVTALTDQDRMPHADFSLTVSDTEGTGPTGASNPEDYRSPSPSRITFAPSDYSRVDIDPDTNVEDYRYQATKPTSVQVINDTLVENDETFTIDLSEDSSNPSHINAAVDDQALANVITINDDDRLIVTTLDSLNVTGQSNTPIALTPGFTASTPEYRAAPAYRHHQVTVQVQTTVDAATAVITPTDADPDTPEHQVDLRPGVLKTVTVTVTAEDGTTTGTYTVNLTRAKPVISITAANPSVTEGQQLTFTVTRSSAAAEALSVNLNVSEDNNLIDSVNEGAKTVSIPANQTSTTHLVPTTSDNTWDEHSTVTVEISDGAFYTKHATAHTAMTKVNDDDFPSANATLIVAPNPVAEAGRSVNAVLTVRTNGDQQPHADGGTLIVRTTDLTALAPSDYAALNQSLTLPISAFTQVDSKYQTAHTYTIQIVDDTIDDEDESFRVTLEKSAGASPHITLATPAQTDVEIIDDDKSRDPTLISLSIREFTESGAELTLTPGFHADRDSYTTTPTYDVTQVTVIPTANNEHATHVILPVDTVTDDETNEDTLGHQVNLAVGSNTITVTVTAEDDSYTKPYTVTATRAKPVITISKAGANDLTEGETASFRITRTPVSTEPLTVSYRITAPSTITSAPRDGTATIAASATSTTVAVPTAADTTWEAHATITAAIRANAASYEIGTPGNAAHTVKDDDFPAANAKITAPATAAESAGTIKATLTVTTSGDTEPHAGTGPIQLATKDGTATAGEDYQSRTGNLSIEANAFTSTTDTNNNTTWSATSEWDLTIINDTDDQEADSETFEVGISQVDAVGETPGTQGSISIADAEAKATITILDDDTSTDADLTSLSVTITGTTTGVTLSPGFTTANTGPYTASVAYPVTRVTVIASPSSNRSTVAYNGTTSSAGRVISVTPGQNRIDVKVSPESGSPKTYTINLSRTKPSVTITAERDNLTEGDSISVTVTRSAAAPDDLDTEVTVSETGDVLAAALERVHTITIPAGSSSTAYTIATTADTIWEEHSTVTAAIRANPLYSMGDPASATVSVKDDDTPAMTLTDSLDSATAHEDTGESIITITALTAGPTLPHGRDFTIGFTKAGTGLNPAALTDYNTTPTTITFSNSDFTAVTTTETDPDTLVETQVITAYQATKTLTVTPVDDSINETNEKLVITLSRSTDTHADITTTALGANTVTIIDNEAALTGISISDTIIKETVSPGTKSYTAEAEFSVIQVTTTATTQHSTESWAVTTPASDANVPADNSDNGHQTNLAAEATTRIVITATAEDGTSTNVYTVTVTRKPTVVSVSTNQDNIVEGTDAVFTFQRQPSANEPTTVTISTTETGDMIDEGSVTTTMTIPSGDASATLTIPTIDDSAYESNSDVTVLISDGNGYEPDDSPDNSSTVTVTDNDPPTGTATTFTAGNTLTVDEDDGTVNVSITVNTGANPTNASITVAMSTADGTGPNGAVSTADYSAASGTLTFNPTDFAQEDNTSPWKAVKTWPVTITDDSLDEDTESFTVLADANTGADPTDLTINIRDNEVGLSTLTLTDPDTDLDQAVTAATTAYTASTPSGTTALTVTATATHSGTTETVPPSPVSLSLGENEITITTTAEDTTTGVDYDLTITRLSADSTIKSLSIIDATPTEGDGDGPDPAEIPFNTPFTTTTTTYTTDVPDTVTHITVETQSTHDNAAVTYTVDGTTVTELTSVELEGRKTVIKITVTPEDTDATPTVYTITITRQSSASSLESLTVTPLITPGLSPSFAPAVLSYNGIALNSTASVLITATSTSEHALISFPPNTSSSARTATTSLTLQNGPNTATVKVQAEDQSSTSTYTITITRQGPAISIQADENEITEGETASFTLTRTGNLAGAQTAPVETAIDDGVPSTTTASFQGVHTTTKVTQTTTDNTTWNDTATLKAILKKEETHELGTPDSANVKILDNDFPEAHITMSISPLQVSEVLQKTTVTITAITQDDQKPNAQRTVNVKTSQGTATAGEDYTSVDQDLTFSPTDFSPSNDTYTASKTLDIPITDDTDVELTDETFTVTLSASDTLAPATLSGTVTQTVTIKDNDASNNANLASLSFTGVSISPQFEAEKTTYSGTAPFDLETTIANAVAAGKEATIIVTPADAEDETTPHDISLSTTPITVTVIVTAQDQTTTKTYTVTITKSNQPIVMEITASNLDGEAISEITEGDTIVFSLTRTATSAQEHTMTVQLTKRGDFTDTESVDFTFAPTDAVATANVDTTDDEEWEEHGLITVSRNNQTASVRVLDNDFPKADISLEISDNTPLESSDSITATVTAATKEYQKPHTFRSFKIATKEGTAKENEDYTPLNSVVTLGESDFSPNGSNNYKASKAMPITILNDNIVEPNETLDLQLSRNGTLDPAVLTDPTSLTITIMDDDTNKPSRPQRPAPPPTTPQPEPAPIPEPVPEQTPEPEPEPEPEPTPEPTPRPPAPPAAPAPDPGPETNTPRPILNTPQRTGAPQPPQLPQPPAVQPRVIASTTTIVLPQGTHSFYTLVLNIPPTSDVTVTPTITGNAPFTITPQRLTFTTQNWNTPQPVTVTTQTTTVRKTRAQSLILHQAEGGNYNNAKTDTVQVTVTYTPSNPNLVVHPDEMTAHRGEQLTYTVSLSTQPSSDVTITLTIPPHSTVQAEPAHFIIDQSNWRNQTTISITGRQPGTFYISHQATGGGYDAAAAATLKLTVNTPIPPTLPPPLSPEPPAETHVNTTQERPTPPQESTIGPPPSVTVHPLTQDHREINEGHHIDLQLRLSTPQPHALTNVALRITYEGDVQVRPYNSPLLIEFEPNSTTATIRIYTRDNDRDHPDSKIIFRVLPDNRIPRLYTPGTPKTVGIQVQDNDLPPPPTATSTSIPHTPTPAPTPKIIERITAPPTPTLTPTQSPTPSPTPTATPIPTSLPTKAPSPTYEWQPQLLEDPVKKDEEPDIWERAKDAPFPLKLLLALLLAALLLFLAYQWYLRRKTRREFPAVPAGTPEPTYNVRDIFAPEPEEDDTQDHQPDQDENRGP